ncbi:MAG: heavy-metal-associated domain-containing protein, partial [Paramuribaculum sp.]|nr:heavy-metal-associated domain-containing protein [Paramuribaculum sp.]
MKKIITLAFAIFMTLTAMAADKATVSFSVNPTMTCQNCENKIKSNLRFEKGVKDIATSLADQLVTVSYDPARTSPEKLAEALKKIGYTATVSNKTAKAACGKQSGCCKKEAGEGCGKKSGKGCCEKASKGTCAKTAPSCPS